MFDFFFQLFSSFCEGIIHQKVLFKADIETSGTAGCLKHITKQEISQKD